MKSLDLNQLGVQEMANEEMIGLDGGWVWAFVAGAIAGGMLYDAGKMLYHECIEAVTDGAGGGAYEGMRWNWH